jgi:GTP cyclohydrolase IA
VRRDDPPGSAPRDAAPLGTGEVSDAARAKAARAIESFLEAIGAPTTSDPELADTGRRVADAWVDELLAGYRMNPRAILREATASSAEGLVVLCDVPTTTMCPHHLLPATGVVHVGYWPKGRVVGLGALGKLVECFSRRLALQEDLGEAIAEAIVGELGAKGAGAVVDLAPTCVTIRGGRHHGARAVTAAFAGEAKDSPSARAELWAAIGKAPP